MKPRQTRSPLDRTPLLRLPGQSLSQQLDDLLLDQIVPALMLALFMVLVAGMEWWRYLTDAKPNPIVYSIVALVMVGYAVYKVLRNKKAIRQLRQGRNGERVVAQNLERFRAAGFFIFHDVPSGDANVDHVLIGPQGIYSIETKTLSKPLRGDCKVQVTPEAVYANGHKLDRNPVIQAKAQAGWLRAFFARHEFKAPVWPVVALPGWFVETYNSREIGAWVVEIKALKGHIEKQRERLTRDEVKALATALASYIDSRTHR